MHRKPPPDAQGHVHKASVTDRPRDFRYVLSDETVDRYGEVIEVAGWKLGNFKRNPIALFGHNGGFPIGTWSGVGVEGKQLVGKLTFAARGTSERIDEIRSLAEQGILTTVSVGFVPKKAVPMDPNADPDDWFAPKRYLEQDLLECSLVSIPANPNAVQLAKSLHVSDATIRLVFGEQAGLDQSIRRRGSTGEHAVTPPIPGKSKMTISERIVDLQGEIAGWIEKLEDLSGQDDLDLDRMDELNVKIEKGRDDLAAMQRTEANSGARAGGFVAPTERKAADGDAPQLPARRPLGMHRKEVDALDLYVRGAVCNIQSILTHKSIDEVLAHRYPGHQETEIVSKAAVLGATTTTAGWAAELVETATAAFMEALMPMSVYPSLAAAGQKMTFGPNAGQIKIPSRASTPSISGSFVGEAAPIPVRKLGLTSKTLVPHKMGVISVFSREIAKYSNPNIESIIRQAILEDTAITIDTLLLDAVAGSAIRPAGLTNGVATLTPTAGGGYAAVLGDLAKLLAPFNAANRSTGNLRLLMNPAQDLNLALMPGPTGVPFGWSDAFMTRFSPIVSTTIPVGDVFMIDVSDFITATGDTPEFDLSEEAVLHMEDTTPLQIGTTGSPTVVAAPTQSMFQTAQIAIRMLLDITWNTRRSGAIAWIDNVTW
jgi:HK97 family phage major capsid protein